jgi:rhomboid-like protein
MHFLKSSSLKLSKLFTRFKTSSHTLNSSPKTLLQNAKRNFGSSKPSFNQKFIVQSFILPFGFVAGVSYLSFYIADEVRKNRKRPLKGLARDFRMFQEYEDAEALPLIWRWLKKIQIKWKYMQSDKTLFTIIGINVFVHILWFISKHTSSPRFLSFMERNFLSHSYSNNPLTLITSSFSHSNTWHIVLNMVAFYSFGSALHHILGQERFVATYLSAAMTSALIGKWGHLLSGRYTSSLGASGAIYALVGLEAVLGSERHRMALIFLPNVSFSMWTGVCLLIAFDVGMILFGKSIFDHYAHLGGMLFGLGYGFYLKYKHNRSFRDRLKRLK